LGTHEHHLRRNITLTLLTYHSQSPYLQLMYPKHNVQQLESRMRLQSTSHDRRDSLSDPQPQTSESLHDRQEKGPRINPGASQGKLTDNNDPFICAEIVSCSPARLGRDSPSLFGRYDGAGKEIDPTRHEPCKWSWTDPMEREDGLGTRSFIPIRLKAW
jgi:hypothetical protein